MAISKKARREVVPSLKHDCMKPSGTWRGNLHGLTWLNLSNVMEGNRRLHTPDAKVPGKETPVPTRRDNEWTPEALRREATETKITAPVANRTVVVHPVASHKHINFTNPLNPGGKYMFRLF
jgi:hypothetical protein